MTVCNKKIKISRNLKKEILVNFNGGNITSDGGLLLIKKIDKLLRLTEKISESIKDRRDAEKIKHDMRSLIKQKIYQLTLGYEDNIDANKLRNDPIFKVAINRNPETDEPLATQSTLSRLENNLRIKDLYELTRTMIKIYKDRKKRNGIPKSIVIDIDPTDDPTHGKQQYTMFHGYYWQMQYYPLLIFDGESGDIIAPLLRPGMVTASQSADTFLSRIIPMIRESFPETKIIIRGDAGFGVPKMYNYCERNKLEYIFGITSNNVLKRHTKDIEEKQKKDFEITKEDQRTYKTFEYKAESWEKERKIISKIEHNRYGSNVRFIVTNISFESAENGYKFYTERGRCENYIKDLKNNLYMNRLSCTSYRANWFRMLMSCFSYVIMQELRILLSGIEELEKVETDTIRLKILKIGGRVKETTRKIHVFLSSSFVFKELFLRLLS